MAKKKQELTSEELLAEALVREEDWPYEVPGNWVWTRLGSVAEIISKGTTPKGGKNAYIEAGVAFLRVENIDDNGIIDFSRIKYIDEEIHYGYLKRSILAEGDVLISIAGTLGRTAIVNKENLPMNTNQALAFIRLIDGAKISNRYIEKALSSTTLQRILLDQTKVTSIPNLTLEIISNCPIPLPPLAEQQRIVDRIESLFDKLDQAKDLIQDALDSFATRKAAILHQAFTGELTKKWRASHGVGMESWTYKPLSELCTSFQYGTSKKSLTSGKVVVIRMGNLQQGEIRWDSLAYTDDKEDIEKYLLKKGDVLFNRTNSPELVGKTSVYRGEYPAIFAGYLIRLKNNDMLNSYYLNYMMNSQRAKIYCNSVKTDGVNQSNINAKKIAAFEIPHCSIPEQQEIVRILDDLFAKEQNAKDLIDLIDQIEAMKKTILGKAFRGELGTNEAGDESAVELLKQGLTAK